MSLFLEDLNAQIKQLEARHAQLQAEAQKQRNEAKATIAQDLIEKIAAYGITAKDLGLNIGRLSGARRGRPAAAAKAADTGKTHTGPDGQTWTEGTRGRKPAWLVQQLAEGNNSNAAVPTA